MTVGERKLPVIQKTEDGEFVNIDGQPFARLPKDIDGSSAGELWKISTERFNEAVEGKNLVTWDSQFRQEQ